MFQLLVNGASWTTILGNVICALCASYALAALGATLWWLLRRRPENVGTMPPVTLLKPLCGAEPGLYDSLRSCCEQDYPHFQIVFGVRRSDDPAIALVERLQAEFPTLDLKLVVDDRIIGANYKISNLHNMLCAARHDTLVIADSDIRVGRDYLVQVTAPLVRNRVGLATCLYRARSGHSICSRLTAMSVNGWFVPSVLVSAAFGWRAFGFGATLAMRRAVLDEIGGFAAVADHIADDYMLGYLVRRCGYRTVLSTYLVETLLPDGAWPALWDHELRQARTLWSLQPAGYLFTFVTFGIPLCAAMLGLTGIAPFALGALALTAAAKLALHVIVSPPPRWRDLWLVPLRDLLSLAVWLWSFAGRRIVWRRHHFNVGRNGVLTEAPPPRRPNYAAAWLRLRQMVFNYIAMSGQRK